MLYGKRLLPLIAIMVAVCGASEAVAASVSLQSAVEQLAKQGEIIIYSDDLVSPDQTIDLETPSITRFREAIAPLGLDLERVGDRWLIGQSRRAPEGLARLHIRAADGASLQGLEATWGGLSHALEADRGGSYRIPLNAGATVTVRADGYEPQVVRISGEHVTDVVLEPVDLVEHVIVTGTRHRLNERGATGTLHTVSPDEMAEMPAVAGDAMRAVTRLPGVSSVGVSAKPLVRGGVQDELLVRLDGVELLDAYHLADFQNLFSIVDDHTVGSVDFYTGGFPARYGNRMSGVMDITTARYTGGVPESRIGVSLFSLLASREASFDQGRGSYVASIRRGNLDQVLDHVDHKLGTPHFWDGYGHVEHRLGDDARLSAGLLVSRDDVRATEDATSAQSDIDNGYLWARLDLDHGKDFSSAASLSLTTSKRSKSQDDRDEATGAGGFLRNQQDLWSLHGRTDFRLKRNGTLMEFGAEVKYGRSRYDSVASIDRGVFGILLGNGEFAAHDIDLTREGWSGGLYWADEVPLSDAWSLQPGVRWDFQSYVDDSFADQVSPRLGIRYAPTPWFSLHLDAGRYFQPQEIQELHVADGDATSYRAQMADQFGAGLEWWPDSDWRIRLEGYDKRYRHTSPRFENIFNPFVLVPELEPDRVQIAPDRARARGLDLELSYRPLRDSYVTLRYGYMDANDHIDSAWVPRRWSQTYTLGGIASWQPAHYTATLAVTWHSGWHGAVLPSSVRAGQPLGTDVLNSARLPDFISIDVALQRRWQLNWGDVTLSTSATNLTNRKNLAGIEYDAEQEGSVVLLRSRPENLLPLVLSVGVLVTF